MIIVLNDIFEQNSILSNPVIAVVLLNYNGRKHLETFLPSVVSFTKDAEIIIADNGSTDHSFSFLQQHYPSLKIIQLENNSGFAGGYNKALEQVKADYYILLNTDVEVTANWINPVIALMEEDPLISACQPKILSYTNKENFEYAGACGGWIDKLGYPFSRGRVFETIENDIHQYDTIEDIFWASGAAMFVRAKVFHELGGFDESYFAHMEEIDLCWRMRLANYSVKVCPRSVVYHLGGGTLPIGSRKVFLNFRNNLNMLRKNLPASTLAWVLPIRILLDWAFALKNLFSGNAGTFFALIKAHIAILRKSPSTHNLSKKKLISLTGVYNGSILVQYFMKQNRTFSKIVKKAR
ncbi:MAG: glycosyltransferase [Chitinophagaceae bacterium]|nr:glycosyltransferase [Chitinophagaceae bacterium]